MLFSRESKEKILEGKKTLTCRAWLSPRVRIGQNYWAQTQMLDIASRFARIKIVNCEEWDGFTLSEQEIEDEGFESYVDFIATYYGFIKRKLPKHVRDNFANIGAKELADAVRKLGRKHYKIRFEVLERIQFEGGTTTFTAIDDSYTFRGEFVKGV